ncbi:MAG TPA: hypothetical protein VMV77_04710 [Bacteroidales bacterium]|nr:hypothetical protein [Bacteroidales bacterium]
MRDTVLIHEIPTPEGCGAFDEGQDEPEELDFSKIDNIEFEDIDYSDYPLMP